MKARVNPKYLKPVEQTLYSAAVPIKKRGFVLSLQGLVAKAREERSKFGLTMVGRPCDKFAAGCVHILLGQLAPRNITGEQNKGRGGRENVTRIPALVCVFVDVTKTQRSFVESHTFYF